MLYAMICKDKPNHLETRLAARPAHIEFLNGFDNIRQAGPMLDDEGNMCGSLVIFEAEDKSEVERFVAGDPYGKAGLFERVEIFPWNRTKNL